MTRRELTERLTALLGIGSPASENVRTIRDAVRLILEDIKEDGVLDVQQPPPLPPTVARMRASLASSGITRDELAACSVQDIVSLYQAMPK